MSTKNILLLALCLAYGLALQAQDDSLPKQLDQVVVTATRYPVKQSQTGKVIIVISRSDLDKSPGKTLGQVLTEQAGLTVNGALNNLGSPESIYLRGAGSGRTLVTIDGIPVSDPSLINNEFDINLLPTENIERIEICKGAQSTLYGSDAIGGVINIITIKPDIQKTLQARASFAAGNYGTYRGNAQVFGRLAKAFVYNIRYTRIGSDGFSSAYDSTGKGHFDNDGYHADVLAANLAWTVNPVLTMTGFAQYSRNLADLDAGAFTDARNYTSASRNLMLGGGLVLKLAGTTIHGNYLFNNGSRALLEDSVYGQTYYSDHYNTETQYVEVFASTVLGKGFTLLNGADYRQASMNEHGLSGSYPLAFKDTAVSQTSMYSSLLYAGKSGLSMELGGRLNTHSRYGSNSTFTFNPAWLIAANWKIYGSVASGYKTPSLYQLYGPFVGNENLQPEKSINYEAGIQFSQTVANVRLTYFNRKIRDGLDYNYFTNKYFNYNQEKDQGIEWEGRFQLCKILSLSANYTWLSAREFSQSRVTYSDTSYDYALKRPANTINLTLGVQPLQQFYVSLSGHYESKRYDLGGYDASFNPLPDVVLKSFCIVNAYAEYKPSAVLKIFVDAKNITNQKFFTVYGYNAIPVMYLAGVVVSL